MTEQQRWWVDVRTGEVQRDDERGPDRHVLGPYPSFAAASAWRTAHEGREEAWADEEDRWEGDGAADAE